VLCYSAQRLTRFALHLEEARLPCHRRVSRSHLAVHARRLLVLVLLLLAPLSAFTPALADRGPAMPANPYAASADWWKHAVIYEIYPRSFADSNNDGAGDLNGITAHLDYLQRLGVDAIWLTPMFPSPQVDFGYDVSDYRNVDPQYGTLADFDRLLREAKKHGIKIILDFVVNHTSDQHPWFKASRQSKTNPYRDFYVWRDGRAPGQPPTNWTSCFGGSSWALDPQTGQYYYHRYYPQQPDLNWRNPEVEKQMFAIMRWWFERGVYGFRLDAVDALYEDPKLTDNPPKPGTDAYGEPNQDHLYDDNLAEVHTELQKMRSVVNQYRGRVLIGETQTDTPAELAKYYGPRNNELQMPMYFNFTGINRLDAAAFRDKIEAVETNTVGGWPVFVLSNHDINRQVDRFTPPGADKDKVAKLLAGIYLTLRGTPILYYGEELGMTNHDPTRREDVKDVIGQKGWPAEKGRDGERTPMQWSPAPNAGFNQGAKPWLPVGDDYQTRNVTTEMADTASVLNWYRQLIRLRRDNPSIAEGNYQTINIANPQILAYTRSAKGKTVLVLINLSSDDQQLSLAPALSPRSITVLASTGPAEVQSTGAHLPPFGVLVAQIN
jgi:alpha-glucosidase